MDPFKDCRRLYSQHFSERMHQYYLPDEQVKMALEDGQRIQEKKGEYVVKMEQMVFSPVSFRIYQYLRESALRRCLGKTS